MVKLSHKQRGITAIIGGMMTHSILGTVYLWGQISVYIASYLHYHADTEYNYKGQLSIVFPIMVQTQVLFIPFGVVLSNKFGIRNICLLGTLFQAGAILACSFVCDQFFVFIMIYGIFTGIPVGILYQVPLVNAYNFFPEKKGLVSGIIVGSFGLGSFIFSWLAMYLINPNNSKAYESGEHQGYFPQETADNLPRALQILSAAYFLIMFVGSFLMLEVNYEQKEEYNKDQKQPEKRVADDHQNQVHHEHGLHHPEFDKNEKDDALQKVPQNDIEIDSPYKQNKEQQIQFQDINVVEKKDKSDESILKGGVRNIPINWIVGLKHNLLYVCIILIFSASSFGFFIAANFKSIGTSVAELNDDFYLTLVGSLANITNFIARVSWGYLSDKIEFKKLLLSNICLSIVITSSLQYVVFSKVGYCAYILVAFFSFGGCFAIFPVQSARFYGKLVEFQGSQLYGIMFQGFGSSAWLQFITSSFLKPELGWFGVYHIYTGLLIFCAVIILLYKFDTNWHQQNLKYGLNKGMTENQISQVEMQLEREISMK